MHTSCDDPFYFFISIIHFLVFGPGRNECEVAWGELLARFAIIGDDGTVAAAGVDLDVV